jgi:putative ABC transport system substrate-binding protein
VTPLNRLIVVLTMAIAAVWPRVSDAQPAGKVVRIGWLSGASAEWSTPYQNALRKGLYDLGYSDSQIFIEPRYANGRPEVLLALAAELVRARVDVIVTATSTPATQAARHTTPTVPVVMVGVGAPVRAGLVANLARPGGNVTGSTILGPEVAAKRLQLLREVLPTASDIALLWNPDNSSSAQLHDELRSASRSLGVRLQSVEANSAERLEPALATMLKRRPSALIVTADPLHQLHIGHVIDWAAKNRLPTIYNLKENVVAGGLMSYGADFGELYRRAAAYVHKIVKGTKPGDLPIEEPTKFELAINLKTARALGLTIPESILARADDVIQ